MDPCKIVFYDSHKKTVILFIKYKKSCKTFNVHSHAFKRFNFEFFHKAFVNSTRSDSLEMMCQTDVEHAVSQVTWGEQRAQTSTMNTFLITDTHIWREWEWYRYWKQEEWLSVFIVKCFQVVYGLGFNHIPDSGSLHRTLTSSLTGSDERLIADIGCGSSVDSSSSLSVYAPPSSAVSS